MMNHDPNCASWLSAHRAESQPEAPGHVDERAARRELRRRGR